MLTHVLKFVMSKNISQINALSPFEWCTEHGNMTPRAIHAIVCSMTFNVYDFLDLEQEWVRALIT